MNKDNIFNIRVYYEDTDAGGVVYHSNYLKYLERARTQILINNKYNHTILRNSYNIMFVLKSCEIDFIKFAKLDDILSVITIVEKKTKVQIHLTQKIFCNNISIIVAKIKLVTVNSDGKVKRMPDKLYNIF